MIVNQNYRRCVFRDCFAKNFSRMNERRVEKATRYRYVALESVLRVEHRHMKFFDRKILQSLAEYFVDIARTAHRNSFVAILRRHAPTELECGVHCYRAGVADSIQCSESRNRLCRQPTQGTSGARKDFVAEADGGIAF
jgi:hypothetical protein